MTRQTFFPALRLRALTWNSLFFLLVRSGKPLLEAGIMKTRFNSHKSLCRSLPLSVFLSLCCASVLSLFALRLDAQPYLTSPVSHKGPTGLTVVRNSEYNNVVSWHALPGATSYILQHRSLYPANLWTDVPGCDPESITCTDITATTSAYAYRVQASNGI